MDINAFNKKTYILVGIENNLSKIYNNSTDKKVFFKIIFSIEKNEI